MPIKGMGVGRIICYRLWRFASMPLLMGTLSDVASERLPVLHIRLNLPHN